MSESLVEGPRDLDQLLLADAERADGPIDIEVGAHPGQGVPRRRPQALPLDEAPPHGLAPEHQVLGDVELGHEGELLRDDGDAPALGFGDAREANDLAPEPDRALVGPAREVAGQDPDERALARPVLAAQGVDLPALEIQVDGVQGANSREILGDPPELQERHGRGYILSRPSCPPAKEEST